MLNVQLTVLILSSEDGGLATAPDIQHAQCQVSATDLESNQLFSHLDPCPPVIRQLNVGMPSPPTQPIPSSTHS